MPAALQISATGTPALASPSSWRISLCVNRERLIGCSVSECLCSTIQDPGIRICCRNGPSRDRWRDDQSTSQVYLSNGDPLTTICTTWPLRGDEPGVTISPSVLRRSPLMPRRYEIPSTPHNMVWGYLDSSTPHILEVNSGDTVTLHSFPSGGKETLPDDINMVPIGYLAALETLPPGPGSHFITGPIYVRGAAVGDALQIDILDVKVRQDWGVVSILPLLGTLPDEFTDYETIHPRIDRERNVCIMPWGSEIPLEPFFGIIAATGSMAASSRADCAPWAFGTSLSHQPRPGRTALPNG